MICPHTKEDCPHNPVCALTPHTGLTHCKSWFAAVWKSCVAEHEQNKEKENDPPTVS